MKSRLLICEDLDDLIASRRTGGLERLLNLADGVLGQGRDLVILITTNVRPNELDPALIRPGRCMANIEFERFSIDEARDRLRVTGRQIAAPMNRTGFLGDSIPWKRMEHGNRTRNTEAIPA
jgi:SpoVK/Ycf46/Vps4 family AAA+-type ATPase